MRVDKGEECQEAEELLTATIRCVAVRASAARVAIGAGGSIGVGITHSTHIRWRLVASFLKLSADHSPARGI